MAKNIIELNGKRYDAVTGKLLAGHGMHTPTTKPSPGKTGNLIDGVTAAPGRHIAQHHAKPQPAAHYAAAIHTPRAAPIPTKAHGVAPHAAAHRPEHAKTLMRYVVKQPTHVTKRHAKVAVHTGALAKMPAIKLAPKLSWETVNESRLKHAKHAERSDLISHFGGIGGRLVAQAVHARPHVVLAAPHHQQPAVRPAAPHTAHSTALPQRQPSTDIFERALAQANSHMQPAPPVRRTRKARRGRQFLSFGTSMLVALFALGFVVYQNVDTIQVHIASSRAGINASMPGWQPSGFSAQQFSYSPGKVVIGFAGDNSRTFSLTQTASKWDSSALLNEYVAPRNQTYDTIQADGRFIYTYGNNNASWVSDGIWYQLNSNGTLSTSQLVHLATST